MSLDQSDLPALPALPPIKLNILQQTFTVGFLLVDIYIVLSSVTPGSEEGARREEGGGRMAIRQISFIMNARRTSFVIVFLIKQLFQNIFTGVWAEEELPTR